MAGVEKAAFVFGLILLCAGVLMIARPHEANIPNNSTTTPYGGTGGDLQITSSGMRIGGVLTSVAGIGFIIAATYRTPKGRKQL